MEATLFLGLGSLVIGVLLVILGILTILIVLIMKAFNPEAKYTTVGTKMLYYGGILLLVSFGLCFGTGLLIH